MINVVAALCDRPADATRDYVLSNILKYFLHPLNLIINYYVRLLDAVMAYNDVLTSNIYKTGKLYAKPQKIFIFHAGLIYFLLYFDGEEFVPNAKLLQKIHMKQSVGTNSILMYALLLLLTVFNKQLGTFYLSQ